MGTKAIDLGLGAHLCAGSGRTKCPLRWSENLVGPEIWSVGNMVGPESYGGLKDVAALMGNRSESVRFGPHRRKHIRRG